LLTTPTFGDAELHPFAGLERLDTSRQRALVDEDVAAVVTGEKAEALVLLVPLHSTRGHR
jgi:hypothetical protein